MFCVAFAGSFLIVLGLVSVLSSFYIQCECFKVVVTFSVCFGVVVTFSVSVLWLLLHSVCFWVVVALRGNCKCFGLFLHSV